MKSIKVIRVLVETSVGLRYAYIQQITPKSLVIIRDETLVKFSIERQEE